MNNPTKMVYLRIYDPASSFAGFVPLSQLAAIAQFMAECIDDPPKAMEPIPESAAPNPEIVPESVADRYDKFRSEMDKPHGNNDTTAK